MKDIGEGTIRRIDWTELTPVILLLRIFNLTLGLRILLIAFIGICLTACLQEITPSPSYKSPLFPFGGSFTDSIRQTILVPIGFFPNTVINLGETRHDFWMQFSKFLGIVAVWILCGGSICRIAAVRLTIDESESFSNLFAFFRRRSTGFVSSLLLLGIGIACCYLPIKLAAWLATISALKPVIAVLMPIPLLCSFAAAVLLVGLTAGWMLLFAAVSTDGSDGFDAVSRMFAYIYQRPLHYILYWIYCAVLGYAGYLFVLLFVWLTLNGVGSIDVRETWTTLQDGQVITFVFSNPTDSFWVRVAAKIPAAYLFAWFFVSSTAIYLLLRRSVDAAPFNEICSVVPSKKRYLPEVRYDEKGAPSIVPLPSAGATAVADKQEESSP